ncbi:uncharacterized protein LOC123037809 [Drosophila rhopaloa]|uniref:Uncharacterized protein n=1 Tax=Drosophila rhopaloa TaxID=1041015 RepID=A0ABM5JBR2_DRORH|nr:uncharacterized protein LOC123037809 [Drosophila rhopaloa]
MDALQKFVTENDLDLVCLINLIDCGYTYEKLQYIENDDLNFIFPNREDTALRSEFRAKLFEWKAKNKKHLPTLAQPISLPENNLGHQEINLQSGSRVCKSAMDILLSSNTGKKIMEQKTAATEIICPEPAHNTIFIASSDMLDCVQKLKFYVGSEEDSMELWAATYELRKNIICSSDNSLDAIVKEFPLFKQAMGHKFVSTMPSFGVLTVCDVS